MPTPGRERSRRLAGELREREVDALLVEPAVDLRYLTGFTGSNGLALIAAEAAGARRRRAPLPHRLPLRDPVGRAGPGELRARDRRRASLLEAVAGCARRTGRAARLRRGQPHASAAPCACASCWRTTWELVPCAGAVERLRAVKDDDEVARIRAASAARRRGAAADVLEGGLVGRTEREVAIELELRMRRLGAEAAELPLDRRRRGARRAARTPSRASRRSRATCW